MKFLVKLRDKTNGFEKEIEWGGDYIDSEEDALYYWGEGNGECDCNRSICLFYETDNYDLEYDCNTGEDDRKIECLGIRRIHET